MFNPLRYAPSFGGINIVVSEHATKLPDAKPRTFDMQEMVDHLHKLGLIQRKPCTMQIGDTMVMHPVIAAKLRETMARRVQNETDRLTMAAIRGRGL